MLATIIVNSPDELSKAAQQLLKISSGKKVFAFYGAMGAGKTTFIKAICNVLGVNYLVNSPTFALVNEYLSGKGIPIFHFDFYRIKSINEVYDMGYEDYFYSDGYCFIEWPEKIEELLPDGVLRVTIKVNENNQRIIEIGE